MKNVITLLVIILLSSTGVLAQDGSEETVQPPNGLSQLEAYYLFYSDYQSDNWESALTNGRWILKSKPESIEGYPKYELATNLDRLISVYEGMAELQTDPTIKAAYLDTADTIFDTVFNTFSKDEIDYYTWHLNRGRMYQENSDFVDNADKKAAAEYKKAFELNSSKMAEGKGYYVRALVNSLMNEDTEESKKEAQAVIDKVEGDANEGLSDYLDKMRNKLFDSPKERIAFLEKKVKENPKDQESIRQLRDIYEDRDNMKEAQQLNKKLYQMDPSFENINALANFALENANYDEAIKYLNEAKGKTDNKEELKSINQSLADAYLNKGDLQQARNSAREVMKIDPKSGRPYITIADIYARAVSECSGSEMGRNDRAVYWLVMDYLNEAKQVDSSVSNVADNRLSSYRSAAPSKEDIFFVDSWKEGSSVQIDGSLKSCYSWINESTTVR